jgi:signal transduction histidine kinase
MKRRLLASMVGLTTFVLLVHDVPLFDHLGHVERDRVVTGLEVDAFTIAGRSVEVLEGLSEIGTADTSVLGELVADYSAETGGRVIVTDFRGYVVVASDEELGSNRDYSSRPEIAGALAGKPMTGERNSQTLGTDLLYVAVPVIAGDRIDGVVRITYPASVIDDRVRSRLWGILAAALVSIVVAIVVAFVLTFTVTGPLNRLRSVTEQLGDENFEATADEESGPPEIRSLARSFNRMRTRLERLLNKQRGFASDASHQLRTPLTALRLQLELAEAAVDRDPESAKRKIEAAHTEIERLQHLVDGLLALARAEARNDALQAVELLDVVRDRIDSWSALSAESGVELSLVGSIPCRVTAMSGVVDQVLDNFIDNAVQYSPSGSSIEVSVDLGTSDATVSVADRGPGMTPEQCEHALDRFWRAPDAAPGGTGLGLAIAARLAEACGGLVSLHPRDGGGLVAQLRLPLAP